MVLVANHQTLEVIEPAKEAFDFPAAPIAPQGTSVLGRGLGTIFLVRRDQFNPSCLKALVERIAVVSFVPDQSSGKLTNEAGSKGVFDEGDFMWRSRGHKDGNRKTKAVCHCHDLTTFAPLGWSHTEPPFLAITKLPSMKHSERSSLPLSRTSSAIARSRFSSTPERTHCWNRRWQVWYGGYRRGRSCQRAPVFKIQRMPSKTSRISFHGRPRPSGRLKGTGIRGLSTSHWASVKSIDSSSGWGSPWERSFNPLYHEQVMGKIHL